ncbi:MAG: ABC transporter ATP-binding protein, partial [Anaerolineae bacterium]|nr:ABC transporter ATP-binding protein [Anaerolineae bacterium]
QSLSARQRRQRASALLAMVGLEDRMDHLPNQLSGGQRQRVAIARSLANEPGLILADEPTGNLDSESGREVIALMRRLNRELGATFVVVTHDPLVARQARRVLVMQDGGIVDDHRVGAPFEEDLKAFRNSGLGQAIVAGDRDVSDYLDEAERRALATLLSDVRVG